MKQESTSTYMENYKVLEEIALSLESQDVADIDKILPEIDRASKAYAVCMERINQVKKVLDGQTTTI